MLRSPDASGRSIARSSTRSSPGGRWGPLRQRAVTSRPRPSRPPGASKRVRLKSYEKNEPLEETMKLTAEQRRQFDDEGYLFFPDCFSEEEIVLMRIGADDILGERREEVWREKSGAPRTAFAAHK